MNLVSNVILNTYGMAILIIIYFQVRKQDEKNSLQYKLYQRMLQITFLLLIIDILGRCDGYPGTIYPIFNYIGNFLLFFSQPILFSIWLLYVHDQVYQEEEKTKLLYPFIIAYNGIHSLLLILTQFFGWIYYIDSDNIYHRGPLFVLSVAMTVSIIFIATILSVVNHNQVERKQRFALAFFLVPPLIATILQVTFYGISFMINGVVLSLLIVFLNVQNYSMYIDYLTKVSNRKKLDHYLKGKINNSTSKKTFSAIMIDLDNFKEINDTYGHDMGDKALQSFVKLLERCTKSKDFIARFGGDEFCIILDVSDKNDLKKIVSRIDWTVEKYNNFSEQPYKLGLSMGCKRQVLSSKKWHLFFDVFWQIKSSTFAYITPTASMGFVF